MIMKVDRARMDLLCECNIGAFEGTSLRRFSAIELLAAIADVESNYGEWNVPRHEQAYCRGGRYHDRELTAEFGCAAHCSYGPWQIMFPTAVELGFTGAPEELANPETNCLFAVLYLEARAADAVTIADIARSFNGGHIRSKAVPQSYIDKLTAAYKRRSQ